MKKFLLGLSLAVLVIPIYAHRRHCAMKEKVYKILTANEWNSFKQKGSYEGSPVDISDGFIHLSTKKQTERVIKKYFHGIRPLYLVEFSDKAFLDKLKWEAASNGDFYPHLYDEGLKEGDISLVQEVYK